MTSSVRVARALMEPVAAQANATLTRLAEVFGVDLTSAQS
jgi:hypothetical protein